MKSVINRLKRASGQIDAIARMIEEEQDCEKIFTQFLAARSAINSAFSQAIRENLEQCISDKDPAKMEKIIQQLLKI